MIKLLSKLYKIFLIVLAMPVILSEYFSKNTGKEYGIGFVTKCVWVFKMIHNNFRIASASDFMQHLVMATRILNIPKSLEGYVVECGCYKGGSSANLSLVCALSNRRLIVCDSFAGLPEPTEADRSHTLISLQEVHSYFKGAWTGTLDEVKNNISRYGKIEVCEFVVGYFEDSLPAFNKKSVFIFLDVDLRGSLEICLKYLWTWLQDGCYLYTHEAHHMEIAALFFDTEWWAQNVKAKSPGLVGAGTGIGLIPGSGGFWSSLGYTVKNPQVLQFKKVKQSGI